MTLLVWNDAHHALGVAAMDETHRGFADLVNRLGNAPGGGEFRTLFAELVAHTAAHFAFEDRLMVETGFPALGEHRSEHDRVLGQMRQIAARVERGLLVMGREYVRELPRWFDLHAATMDSALAAHLKAKGVAS